MSKRIPMIDVEVILLLPNNPKDNKSWLIVECPFCKKHHMHGAGGPSGDTSSFLGSRAAHCNMASEGYNLVWNNYEIINRGEKKIEAIVRSIKNKNRIK